MGSDRTLTRIGGLLRQAESTDNEYEAATFLAAAQRLATQASIDLAVARAHVADRERRPQPTQRIIEIGEAGRKGLRTYVQLFLVIARANDVRCDISRSSTLVFAYGFDTDIDTCETLYASLLWQMVAASDRYLKSGVYRSETVERVVTETRGRRRVRRIERVPLAGVTARLNFQLGYAERIGIRLGEAQQQAERAALTGPAEAGTALALRNKQVELTDYYTGHSTARGAWRGAHAPTGYSPAARQAGDRAGHNARLGTEPQFGAPRGSIEA